MKELNVLPSWQMFPCQTLPPSLSPGLASVEHSCFPLCASPRHLSAVRVLGQTWAKHLGAHASGSLYTHQRHGYIYSVLRALAALRSDGPGGPEERRWWGGRFAGGVCWTPAHTQEHCGVDTFFCCCFVFKSLVLFSSNGEDLWSHLSQPTTSCIKLLLYISSVFSTKKSDI